MLSFADPFLSSLIVFYLVPVLIPFTHDLRRTKALLTASLMTPSEAVQLSNTCSNADPRNTTSKKYDLGHKQMLPTSQVNYSACPPLIIAGL